MHDGGTWSFIVTLLGKKKTFTDVWIIIIVYGTNSRPDNNFMNHHRNAKVMEVFSCEQTHCTESVNRAGFMFSYSVFLGYF